MKYIKKETEPASLATFRFDINANDFDNYDKSDLQEALLKEQKYICCYCMQSISKDRMRIEHWKTQSDFPELQLVYSNLLAACLGNEGQPRELEHCDVHRKNTPITINPTLRNCEILVKFEANGKVYSDDISVNKDLNETLNLNCKPLKINREKVLKDTLSELEKKHKGAWSKEVLQRELEKWEAVNDNKYKAYCQIVIYHLKKKLNRVS